MRRVKVVPAGSALDCDVLIIGSGPAGLSVAMEMTGTTHRTILLDSGGQRETAQSRDLLRGFVWPEGSHEPLETNRRRQFGGSSTAWGGRCIPMDPIDFVHRPWIPFSGWPIDWNDVNVYLTRATFLCEAGDAVFDAASAFPERQREMIAGFDGVDVVSSPLERWGPPTNFAQRYGPLLDRNDNITILLNATAVGLQLDPATRRVEYVDVAATSAHRFTIRARNVVLACGGIENARMLLSANNVVLAGLGNEFDQVGRYYMSHVSGMHAWAQFKDRGQNFIFDFERHNGTYVRRRLWITPEAQRRERIGNASASFLTPFADGSSQSNALSSAVFIAKFAIGLTRQRSAAHFMRNRKLLLDHTLHVMRSAPRLLPQVAEAVRQRYFAKRRLPILLPRKDDLNNSFGLCYQTEHMPNPDSRIVLHPERDALGLPRAEMRVAFTDRDVQTVLATHAIIKEQFRSSGTGDLIYDQASLENEVRDRLRSFDSAAHHIGTTRMSSDPTSGVVDKNCRVHGTQNLFVAGSSVFPTSGHANPTLMIVALALRLAAHLKTL